MFKYFTEVIFTVIGITIILISNFVVALSFPFIVPILNVVGGLIAFVPPILVFYIGYKTKKEIEQQFMMFIKDFTESINSGMTLPLALEHSQDKDYGPLSPHIKKLGAQVNWGIPFQKALAVFAKNLQSLPIKRAVKTIIETYKVGGKISDTLNAVGKCLITIDKIKKERATSVHSQIITSYLIYFVFIFILIILQAFLIPSLVTEDGGLTGVIGTETPARELYTQSFIYFIIIQGFFAGLATGKMAEGSLVAGLKHSVLLIVIGYTLFTITIQFEINLF